MIAPSRKAKPGLGEVLAVWTLFGVVAAEILVTYARLPAGDLYHVSGTGLRGGASRALVFLGYPTSLVAMALLAVVADRLRSRTADAAALVAALLCATVAWPGVIDQANLDAKWANALAAIGVAIAVALTVAAVRAAGTSGAGRSPGDPARLALGAALLVMALPWLAADLGFSFDSLPVLGTLFQTGELRAQPGQAGLHPAVHHGHHHGMDGVLLALSALALSRALAGARRPRLRAWLTAYLGLVLAYGLANAAQDFWLEQSVKRGWTSWQLPSVVQPRLTWGWGVIVVAAAVLTVGLRRLARLRPALRR